MPDLCNLSVGLTDPEVRTNVPQVRIYALLGRSRCSRNVILLVAILGQAKLCFSFCVCTGDADEVVEMPPKDDKGKGKRAHDDSAESPKPAAKAKAGPPPTAESPTAKASETAPRRRPDGSEDQTVGAVPSAPLPKYVPAVRHITANCLDVEGYFGTLNIDHANPTLVEIKEKYKKAALAAHPDKHRTCEAHALDRVK